MPEARQLLHQSPRRHYCKRIVWAYPGYEAQCCECDWTSGVRDTADDARAAAYRHLYGIEER